MSKVRANPAYQEYKVAGNSKVLNLPNFEVDEQNNVQIHIGELYCRVKGCQNTTCFSSTNNLKKHLTSAHNGEVSFADSRGGRPLVKEEERAIAFYEEIVRAYNEDGGEIEAKRSLLQKQLVRAASS